MAAATAMDIHDRRLSTNKSSAKIKKTTASSSSATSSSATSAPSRPVAKVVNADPSSFRRVVQELTGSPSPSPSSASSSPSRSSSSPSSLHHPSPSSCTPPAAPVRASRLQRCAPPPLRPDFKNLSHVGLVMNGVNQGINGVNPALGGVNQGMNGVNQGMNGVNPGINGVHQGMNGVNQGIINESFHGNANAINSQHHLSYLLLWQQQQQQELQLKQREQQQQHQYRPSQPPPSMVRPPPPPSPTLLGNTHMNQDANGQFALLPMLSPHLLSPLPALTPGDNTWASPLDAISGGVSPGSMAASASSSLPSLLPLPSSPKGNATMHGRASVQSQLASQPAQQQQPQNPPLPPLLPSPAPPQLPVSPSGPPFAWPPFSPTFLPLPPFSPSFLPPSPGSSLQGFPGGAPGAMAFSSPRDFSFRGINDYSMFRPT